MSFTLEDTRQAIHLSFKLSHAPANDLETAQLKQKVGDYLTAFQASTQCWKLSLELIESQYSQQQQQQRVESSDEIKFYALQRLRDVLAQQRVDQEARIVLRERFVSWLKSVVAGKYQAPGGQSLRLSDEKGFIRNYCAVVYTLLLKSEYPGTWKTGFDDLFQLVVVGGVHGGIELFLKVLLYVDQEVVTFDASRSSVEVAHNTLIKDTMRLGVLDQIVDLWYCVLVSCKESNPKLVHDCLKVMQEYIGWIDVNSTVNDRILPLLYYYIGQAKFQVEATDCLYELLDKGMSEEKKLEMILHIKIIEAIEQICFLVTDPAANRSTPMAQMILNEPRFIPNAVTAAGFMTRAVIEHWKATSVQQYQRIEVGGVEQPFLAALADVAALIGMELHKCEALISNGRRIDASMRTKYFEASNKVCGLILDFFLGNADIQVRKAAVHYIDTLVAKVRTDISKNDANGTLASLPPLDMSRIEGVSLGSLFSRFLPPLIPIIFSSVCYPEQLDFADLDPYDEEYAEVEEFRKQLRKVFVNICRFALKELVVPYLKQQAEAMFYSEGVLRTYTATDQISRKEASQLEGFLFLLQALPEGTGTLFTIVLGKGKMKGGTGAEEQEYTLQQKQLRSEIAMVLSVVMKSNVANLASQPPYSFLLSSYNLMIARYISLIVEHDQTSLGSICRGLISQPGISNDSPQVRSQATYLLLRIVKAVGSQIAPFAFDLLKELQPALDIPIDVAKEEVERMLQQQAGNFVSESAPTSTSMLTVDDLLNIYEMAGILIGTRWPTSSIPEAQVLPLLTSITDRLVDHLSTINTNISVSDISAEQLFLCAEWTSHCVMAGASLSKGFAAKEIRVKVCDTFVSFMEKAFGTLAALSNHTSYDSIISQATTFSKLIMFSHRMVAGFRESILQVSVTICQHLMSSLKTLRQCVEYIQFLNQITREYRTKLTDVIDQLIQPVMTVVSTQLSSPNVKKPDPNSAIATLSEEEKEYLELEKVLLTWFYEIITAKLSCIFFSERNESSLDGLLSYLCERAAQSPTVLNQKICFTILCRLVGSWLPDNAASKSTTHEIMGKYIVESGGALAELQRCSPPIGDKEVALLKSATKNPFDDVIALPDRFRYLFIKVLFEKAALASIEAVRQRHFTAQDGNSLQLVSTICLFHITATLSLREPWLGYLIVRMKAISGDQHNEYVTQLLSEANIKVMRGLYCKALTGKK